MNHDNHLTWLRLHIVEQLFKPRAVGDLLPPGAALVIFVKDGLRQAAQLGGLSDSPLLRVDAVVVFLHFAGPADVASEYNVRVVGMIRLPKHGIPPVDVFTRDTFWKNARSS